MHKVLFISYWGISEGLTRATVLPHLEILSRNKNVEKIILCTIEREEKFTQEKFTEHNISHFPLVSSWQFSRLTNKFYDFSILPLKLKSIIKKNALDTIIARGAPAGALALKVINKHSQFIVESFEPHAQYMFESGIWPKNGLSYKLEKSWEEDIIQKADQIITVSTNYRKELEMGSSKKNKFYTVPCAVEPLKFKFSKEARDAKRIELNIPPNAMTGIYVGKFGGLYLEKEAFQVFKQFLNQKDDNRILILSPNNHEEIRKELKEFGIAEYKVNLLSVFHDEVPMYLSAADVAFALYKTSKAKSALSPIKIGEYWANGLPILITEGIGDDSDIIVSNNIGSILDLNHIEQSIKIFIKLVNSRDREEWNDIISPYAKKYRSFNLVRDTYLKILNEVDKG